MKKSLLFLFSLLLFSPLLSNAQCSINAGSNQSGCIGTTHILSANAVQFTAFTWSTSGSGTFSNPANKASSYYPSEADISAGTVTLTITGSGGGCTTASSSLTLAIFPWPTIDVGFDQTICGAPGNSVPLSAVTNGIAIQWSSSGSGTFLPDATSTNVVYLPSASDNELSSLMLYAHTISAQACTSPMDDLIVTILPKATVSAGFDQTICTGAPLTLSGTAANASTVLWTTAGSGTFSNTTTLQTTYVPSAADAANGSVTLTLKGTSNGGCTSSDDLVITILPKASVSAGFDQTLCAAVPVELAGATAANTSTVLWTTAGSGTFSNTTTLQTMYQPSAADAANGSVTLTLTATSNSGCTSSDNVILTFFSTGERVNAGADQVLASGPASLSGTAVGTGNVIWTTNGTGTFTNNTALQTVYTPSDEDVMNGIVKIKLASTTGTSCNPAEDELMLTIGADLKLSGTIQAGTAAVDKAVVLLFKQQPSVLQFITSDTVDVSDNGSYTFNHIPDGVYVLFASPATGSSLLNTYLPTYSGGVQTWNTAEQVSVTGSDATFNIALTAYTSTDPDWNTGADIITGGVDIPLSAPANTRVQVAAVAAPYVIVFLTNAAGNKIAYTQTDNTGRYVFKNVKQGVYYIVPEFSGTALAGNATSVPVTTDGSASTTSDGSFSLQARTSSTTGILHAAAPNYILAYPNPAKNNISLHISKSAETGEVKVLNQTGIISLQQPVTFDNQTLTLNIESLPAGIYMLQLVAGNELYTSKIIKQ